jgi:hypothetical protein
MGKPENFADTVGMVAGLDLIISLASVVAHLDEALGKPCLVLWAVYSALALLR